MTPGFEGRKEIVDRAKARVLQEQVRYGSEVAYPSDMELMLDLVGLIGSLEMALKMAYETPLGCICQEQHRRGYCTEPGCPYSVSRPAQNSEAK